MLLTDENSVPIFWWKSCKYEVPGFSLSAAPLPSQWTPRACGTELVEGYKAKVGRSLGPTQVS